MTRDLGIVTPRDFTFAGPGEPPFVLDSGAVLAPVTLRYETYGALNAARDNAIVVAHSFSADHHAAGRHSDNDAAPGWWDVMIGPGKAIDTDRWFVMCANVLGGCRGSTGPRTINPATGRPWGNGFPRISIGDIVRAQVRLLDHLGIARAAAVVGGSLGGMQAVEWAVSHGDRVRRAVVIAAAARTAAQTIAFNAVARRAIEADPAYARGDGAYESDARTAGLGTARLIGEILFLSFASMERMFGRNRAADGRYAVEAWLDDLAGRFVRRFDPTSFVRLSQAIDDFDAGRGGPLHHAFRGLATRFLVVPFTTDLLFPLEQSAELAQALRDAGADVTYAPVETDIGHDAFLLEFAEIGRIIARFLNEPAP